MRKKLIILMALLLVLSSCTYQENQEIVGYKGLEFSIIKGNPSTILRPLSGSSISVRIRNVGAASTKSRNGKGIYVWWSLSPSKYLKTVNYKPIKGDVALLGGMDTRSSGEERNFFLGSFILKGKEDVLGEFHNSHLFLDIYSCYPYYTLLQDKYCVDVSMNKVSEMEQICNAKEKDYYGQGAPIAITHIRPLIFTPEINGEVLLDPAIELTIENRDKGIPLFSGGEISSINDLSPVDLCEDVYNGNIRKEYLNKVGITAYLSNIKLDCDEVKLINNKAVVRCKVPLNKAEKFNSKTNFYTSLVVRLDYDYFCRPISEKIWITE